MRCTACGLVFAFPLPELSLGALQDIYDEHYTEEQRQPLADSRGKEALRVATNRQMDIVERYVQKGRALNVGAMGGAIKVLEERGWELCVVEASEYAADTARRLWGLDVTVSRIEDYSCPPDTFDFIKLVANQGNISSKNKRDSLCLFIRIIRSVVVGTSCLL